MGLVVAQAAMDMFRLPMSAACVGLGWQAINKGIKEVLRRDPAGQRSVDQQAVQWALAEVVGQLEGARAMIAEAAASIALPTAGIKCLVSPTLANRWLLPRLGRFNEGAGGPRVSLTIFRSEIREFLHVGRRERRWDQSPEREGPESVVGEYHRRRRQHTE